MAFCEYLEELATERDIPAWDKRGRELQVTGLGDVFPIGLDGDRRLFELVECAREISASQIYGKWQPEKAASFLRRAASLAEYDLTQLRQPEIFKQHDPTAGGWGAPVDESTTERWRVAAEQADEAVGPAARTS